jgi:uncharacterized protein YjcR
MEIHMMDHAMGTKAIAAYLGVSVKTVHNWRKREGLPSYRISVGQRGGKIIYMRTEVRKWLDEYKDRKASILI